MQNKQSDIPTLGILGGGQLARMTAYAAFHLGMSVAIFEEKKDAPCQNITPFHFTGAWNDTAKLTEFAEKSDIITLENEFVAPSTLEFLESLGKPVFPSSKTLKQIQDKFTQKTVLKDHGLPVSQFYPIDSENAAYECGKNLGYPFLIKRRKHGYDGYGNRTVHSEHDIPQALAELGFPNHSVYAEGFIDFELELATMIARSKTGEIVTYPVVETIQENHICKYVIAPARLSSTLIDEVISLAKSAIERLDGVGIFGVEMFLDTDANILINELAPRPHNSGHYTMEACYTSQFQNLLRAIFGWKLGSTQMVIPAAVMVNLLGKRNGLAHLKSVDFSKIPPVANLHIYGKSACRVGRKMGHLTVRGNSVTECLSLAQHLESQIEL
ncbi:phosphoribosylaminoimidazole carboxylase, ATPase subunit [Chloroherpeton thalassium ATCC 35110]|uniref:N5-carboxyaminoimidazole ribonucleotide synthase n=1 Tax=Chloroherpeton thalassium (strain ATCC 35110 / GB-78) TaxID=517418 RepID=B3QTA1_CHLT3|nr:5-(carboxyamino)imidazole ribonucleotide synthase [Chloroherpeton thalassium]ACF14200.1 phosphoribosylaminoimidazole carboxylase, ATPase subunit [Chloroherpeton thalassium ATCC 35110]